MIHNAFVNIVFFILVTGVMSLSQRFPPSPDSITITYSGVLRDSVAHYKDSAEYWAAQKIYYKHESEMRAKRNLQELVKLVNRKPDTFIKYIDRVVPVPADPNDIVINNGTETDYSEKFDTLKGKRERTKAGKILYSIFH